jgi:outer membrane protein assembly factor BamD (BamD/ComL family)
VANYYWIQGNLLAVRQRLELILKDYPRTLVVPETLFLLAEVNAREGLADEATKSFRRLVEEYPYTEWGRRAVQRLNTAAQR